MKRRYRVRIKKIAPHERVKNFEEILKGYTEKEAVSEAKRCLHCQNPTCVKECPAHLPIPEFIAAIKERNFEKAASTIRQCHGFPDICGRVCPQEEQCEKGCIFKHRRRKIAIGHLERFVGDWARAHQKTTEKNDKRIDKKVTVIGSGPAGLTVADELVRAGVSVTVFENLPEYGGLLFSGIPKYRLPKPIVKAKIEQLKNRGVKFISQKVSAKTIGHLYQNSDALFLGMGADQPYALNIPGEESPSVYSYHDFLLKANSQQELIEPKISGKKVIIIGGGNVAMDVSRVALRLGATESVVCYRRVKKQMPARKYEITAAKQEKVKFNGLLNPVEILLNEEGDVSAIRFQKMRIGKLIEGRRLCLPEKGAFAEIACDAVITAIGAGTNREFLNSLTGLTLNEKGLIKADERGRTSYTKVYAAGDNVTGSKTVIEAIAAAKATAKQILEDILISK